MTKQVNNAFVLNRLNQTTSTARPASKTAAQPSKSFNDVLQQLTSNEITLSKHAAQRLETRGIALSKEDFDKVSEALKIADQRGVNEALIVMDKQLLIASVANKTIITAAQSDDLKAKIITKIDGAIFI